MTLLGKIICVVLVGLFIVALFHKDDDNVRPA